MNAHPTAVWLALHGVVPMVNLYNSAGSWRLVPVAKDSPVLWYMPVHRTWVIATRVNSSTAMYEEVEWSAVPAADLDLIKPEHIDLLVS